ncbi:hypothetical protein KBY22_02860 [Ruegeria pomeroyi]|nr:hypothetical protein [Ruegeria pomeroyi]MCE8527713.1 hypothetical protein [Ruegeria pomeroyi]
MTAEFWITTAAIVAGPLMAVLIAHYLQKSSDTKQRRLQVFRSLMSTRRTPLSPERVQALNLVEIEFAGQTDVLKEFKELLKIYNDQVKWKSDDENVRKSAVQEVDDKTAQMLREMGRVLGYKFENLELLRGGYYPEAFSILDDQQNEIREFFVGLNNGSKLLPTAVVDVRHPEKLLEQAREAQLLLESAAKSEVSK